MKKNTLLILLFIAIYSSAQLPMGKWRTHFAYNAIAQITQSDNKIFAVSEGSLFSIDKNQDCIENEEGCKVFYGKMNGLNDGMISRIGYDKLNKKLLIIYKNGNIDLMTSGGITNVPDLYNKQMSISKEVNDISFRGDFAYLSCNFGIVVLNTKRNEIADSYFIGPNGNDLKILSTSVVGNNIYALSNFKLQTANINEQNLANYEYWSDIQDIPGSGDFKKIDVFADKLILQRGDRLYSYSTNIGWQNFLSEISVTDFHTTNNKLIIYSSATTTYIVDQNLSTKLIENAGEILDAEYDETNKIFWFGANAKGLMAVDETGTNLPKFFKPSGPAVNSPWSMTFAGEKLFVVPGGRWNKFDEKPGRIMVFEKEKWTNILNTNIEKETNIPCLDIVSVGVNPNDNKHFFAASASSGIYEFRDTTFVKLHNSISTNNIIENLFNSNMYNIMDGATFDNFGNFWCTNSFVNKGLKVRKEDGTWIGIDYLEMRGKSNLNKILFSNVQQNQIWVNNTRYAPGIFVADNKGTIEDTSDDNSIFLSSFADNDNEGAKISPSNFYCLAQDHNGVIWVGTEQGPLLFYNTSKVFDSGYTCSRVKIPRNDGTGLADYLLQSDKVKAIAIDGANRKWIGTESSGVYLMSENGQETIKQFTTKNSPLLSDDIISIAINPVSGEVFFGTSNGLVSYQGDANNANDAFKNVHAYPNPVRENYDGIITITGLVKDTQVKITDLNGNLICQTISNGGIATWDGKNSNGKKVNTGIYLVICVNNDGTQSTASKIMVIN